MPISTSPFRLALLPFSLMLAYGSNVYAQQVPTEEASKANQTQPAPPKLAKSTNQSDEAKPAAGQLQKVEISGVKGYDERRQDTASKIVVTQEDIIRYGDTNIGDVLKRLPGVTIGGVQGRGGSIRMRGLGAGYTQIMLNGEPSPPGFSLDSISPDNIERIEVIRSATAELSTQSIAGAINIVLKRAIVTAQRELKVGMQEDGGKYGGNVSLQFSDKLGRLSYSISGNVNQGKYERFSTNDDIGTDSFGNIINRHSDVKDWGTFTGIGLSPRVNWNLENGDTVTSQSFVNANQFSGFNQQKSIGSLPLYVSDISAINSKFEMIRSNLNWVHKLADSAKLDVKLGANYNKRSSDVAYQGYGESGLTLDRKANTESSDQGLTYGGKYTAPFVTDHSIAAGWDGAFSKRNETRLQNDVISPASDPSKPKVSPINLNEIFDAEVSRLAVFVQDEWSVSKNWSIYAGLRWEGLETTSKGNTYTEVKNTSSVWSPILQTLWKIPGSKNDQVRFGLTQIGRAHV